MQLAMKPPMDAAPPQTDLGMASLQNPTGLSSEGMAMNTTMPMSMPTMPVSPMPAMFGDAVMPGAGGFGAPSMGDFGGPSFDLSGLFG
jgi:hypothetical protein